MPATNPPLAISHRRNRANIGAALTAAGADKPRLNVRQPHVVSPSVRNDRDRIRAVEIGTVD
jgi:hypothetical protein